MSTLRKILHEIGNLSLIISIPQLISAPLSVILISLLSPIPTPNDLIDIVDFFVTSFPLTLAIALITHLSRTDDAGFIMPLVIIIGAAFLSNFLHQSLSSAFPAIDIAAANRENFRPDDLPGSQGSGSLFNFVMRIISLYWEKFGVILFLQSCVIGIYAGLKYFKKGNT